ncbi:MAG: ABC transporter permease [Planctomycetota bacterium]|jgi:ribose/xylose/arabinose/galactoside ABC-type transport system permease subunit|nr:ABC transporter permease [Planctomycetota bacterium]
MSNSAHHDLATSGRTWASGRSWLRDNMSRFISLASIVLLVIIFTVMNPNFLGAANVRNLLTDISPLLVMSCGVALVLLLGSIDLSMGSIASCSAVMLTLTFTCAGWWSYALIFLFGVFAGFLNGILHAKLKVPSFIATLSTQSIWQSAAFLLSGGQPLTLIPKNWGYVNWVRAKSIGPIPLGPIPPLFLIGLVLMIVYYVYQSRTETGKTMMALGANERAARLIGLGINRAKIVAFTFSGIGAAVAGMIFAVKLKSGIPTVGEQYNLIAIASAALGGVALTGGRGHIILVILGVGLITVIQNGMNVIAVDGFWQQIVFGLLVLAAIYMNSDRRRRDLVVK